jgi:uncharacterized protein YcnI
MRQILPLAALAALALAGPALAHVSFTPVHGNAGREIVLKVRVGHGCDGQDTTAVRLTIPDGVEVVRADGLPNWRARIENKAGRAVAVTWRGKVAHDAPASADLRLRLPKREGWLYFPAVQTCGKTAVNWTDIPKGDEGAAHPAPAIEVGPEPIDVAKP